jgi:hypothetical protein
MNMEDGSLGEGAILSHEKNGTIGEYGRKFK